MALAAGTRVGSYEILGLLGAGGMGEVWKARDTRLGREVAIKVLPADFLEDEERKARFEREARALASLNHPGIAAIYSFEEIPGSPGSPGRHLLVMELIRGRPLSELIEPGGLPLKKILDWAIPIGDALAAAHAHGVVHRDLKPANIMVTDEGRPKILDFGLARVSAPPASPSLHTESMTEALTAQGNVFGTVPYMAPEQLRGERTDARADIFSFGAMLYEMASGRRPFTGATGAEVVASILKEDAPPLEGIRTDLPAAFVRIVRHCLEKDPRQRQQSASDLSAELKGVEEELSSRPFVPSMAAAPPPSARRPGMRIAAVAGAALLLVAAAVFLIPRLRTRGGPRADPIRTIAVLPFENLAKDPGQDFFVDGMHDALITDLAKLGTLRVTSRTSVMRYKGQTKPLKEIAAELGVDALIEGSVLRSGNQVRITAQLIRGATDEHVWAESYDRKLEDVLQLLRDVSRSIATEVRLKVAGGTGPALPAEPGAAPKVRPEAWEAYLRGRKVIMEGLTLSVSEVWKALGEFRRAVDLDPGFAKGWSGVATANFVLGFFRQAPAAEAIPAAREAALKALALDDQLGEAHGVLGTIELYYDWNFPSAKERLERAVALNPHNFLARHAWADYLMVTGRFEESLEQVKIGRSYEPTSPLAEVVVLFHTMATRRFDEVIAEARRVTAAFPKFGMAHGLLGNALWKKGKYDEAIAEYRLQFGAESEGVRLLETELRRAGPKAALKAHADYVASQMQAGRGSALSVANAYAEAGERDFAFQWLEKAYAERAPQLLHIVADTAYDGLREDPRYKDLLRRIGIPMATQ